MLLPVRAVCKAMANRKYCPRTVVLSKSRQSTVSHICPHTAPCVRQPQRDRRNRDWVSGPPCRLCWQASDEQPLVLAVSQDANTARIFSQWHFPLDIATARSSPISFIFLFFFFKKSHTFLKTESFNIHSKKKKRAFQPLLWVHSQS